MILDYSRHVEVVAREADGAAYSYFLSDRDLAGVAPRLLSRFRAVRRVAPVSWGLSALDALAEHELAELTEQRVDLFNSIEAITIPDSESSLRRELVKWLGTTCYVCRAPTQLARDERSDSGVPHVVVRACPECGWWESENTSFLEVGPGAHYDSYTLLRRACLREFAILDDAAPLDALRAHLARHPESLNSISPRKLELLVGSVFSDFLSCEAIHVGGPADGGYDLVLLMGDNPALVQVKQRADPRKTEPVSSIREFVGALVLAGKSVGFFVSTARRFSTWAKESAERASGITLKRLELVDASKLMDILRMVSDRVEPWTKYAHSLDEKSQDFGSSREAKLFGF